MARREYIRYLTEHEYINLCTMRKAIGKIHRRLNDNKNEIYKYQRKIAEKSSYECNLYNRDMIVMLGKERRMLKNTRQKIERLADIIVKKAQRRMEDIKLIENTSL
ncbi:hypothetical protein [uncultured Methanobrevibacter sp.]|uniref:hypothetical protein n=1 Tax=uncultured Methanobrevibacter sp. TaxID=253161 RepID=UPI0025E6421C|nr:hypothetical protein [uncultured Methanobrevibacter sp.]